MKIIPFPCYLHPLNALIMVDLQLFIHKVYLSFTKISLMCMS